MNGAPSDQPNDKVEEPKPRVETGATDVRTVGAGEVVTNNTQAGRDRIAALLADTIDNGTNGTSMS